MLSSLPLSSSSEDVLDDELELLTGRWWEGTYMYKREREEGGGEKEEEREREREREEKESK